MRSAKALLETPLLRELRVLQALDTRAEGPEALVVLKHAQC